MIKKEELLNSLVEIVVESNDQFLVIRETLTRIGIPNEDNDELFQHCFLFHKRGRYYICHYKHLLLLNNKIVLLTQNDAAMAHLVASKLVSWGLTEIIPNPTHTSIATYNNPITIVQSKDKKKWKLTPKYIIGKRQFS